MGELNLWRVPDGGFAFWATVYRMEWVISILRKPLERISVACNT